MKRQCNEGILSGQLRVLFGVERCLEILLSLKAIFITHAHQDHMNGLYTMILRRHEAFLAKGESCLRCTQFPSPDLLGRISDVPAVGIGVSVIRCNRSQIITMLGGFFISLPGIRVMLQQWSCLPL